MSKKKTPKAPDINYLAIIREKFPSIPDSPREVQKFITATNNARKQEKLPPLSESRMVDTASKYFWDTARAANPGLGINERTNLQTASAYNNASKSDVRWRFSDAVDALGKSVPNLPSFFSPGSTMTVMMEGLALKKNPSHTDTDGSFLGIAQFGHQALFQAWSKLQEIMPAVAANLPAGHSYKNMPLSGAKLWENAGAIHVQVAALYAHMEPDLKRLDKIPNMSEMEKASLMPVLNTIPGVGRYVMSRMEQGDPKTGKPITLADIKLSDIKDPAIQKMMANNPRVYVQDKFTPNKKLTLEQNRIAHFKDNMGDVLAAVLKNTVSDAKEVIAQTEPKAARDKAAPVVATAAPVQTPTEMRTPTKVIVTTKAEPPAPPITPPPAARIKTAEPTAKPGHVAENVPLPRASPLRGKMAAPAALPSPPPQRQASSQAPRTLDQQAATLQRARDIPVPPSDIPGDRPGSDAQRGTPVVYVPTSSGRGPIVLPHTASAEKIKKTPPKMPGV